MHKSYSPLGVEKGYSHQNRELFMPTPKSFTPRTGLCRCYRLSFLALLFATLTAQRPIVQRRAVLAKQELDNRWLSRLLVQANKELNTSISIMRQHVQIGARASSSNTPRPGVNYVCQFLPVFYTSKLPHSIPKGEYLSHVVSTIVIL